MGAVRTTVLYKETVAKLSPPIRTTTAYKETVVVKGKANTQVMWIGQGK